MTDIATPKPAFCSRAVLRRIEAGCMAICAHCGQQIKFAAKLMKLQAIANVYVGGRWDRVEHYHEECYEEAGEPFGETGDVQVSRSGRSSN